MYLKNLTALGFKSFADKTSMDFREGITAIVGPNGCGKSNVADAIRWVLGEQSAKALRGGDMKNMIFNGTDTRKPLGMAEVSLTIGDVDREQLKAAGVDLSYHEVTLTRRVFRDGGSEYFLNRTPCRLRDIQQLFLGTGVGRSSYSIMAQGNITQILSSKPEERRMVFEEAAGITKFKAQKREALRKLEHTEQNLLRIEDLVREVKRQIGSLQRQAGKARRYKEYQAEMQHLETQLARHQYDVLQAEVAERREKAAAVQARIRECNDAITHGEVEIERLRHRLEELDEALARGNQQAGDIKNRIENHESRIRFNEERLAELEEQHRRANTEITQAEERRQVAKAEADDVAERMRVSSESLETCRQRRAEREAEVEAAEREVRAQQESLHQLQNDAFHAAQDLARVRNELNALDLKKQGDSIRLEKLGAERIQVEEERQRLEERMQEFNRDFAAEKHSIQSQQGTVEERQARLRGLHQEIQHLTDELEDWQRQRAEHQSRLRVLEQLQETHEGFTPGTQAALQQRDLITGSLVERIRVADPHIKAVETALDYHLQLVLTDRPESALRLLGMLREDRRGRARVAALDMVGRNGDPAGVPAPPAHLPCTPAIDVIEAEDEVVALVRRLIGRTMIVPNLEVAANVWHQANGDFDLVTADGEMLTRNGVFTGGHGQNGSSAASVLGRKNEIESLRRELAAVQTEVDQRSRNKGAMQAEQTELQAGLQEAQSELRQREVAIATREGEFHALQKSLENLGRKLETIAFETSALESQEADGRQKYQELTDRRQELAAREEDLRRRADELGTGLEHHRERRDQANAALTEAKVAVASEEQLCAALQRQQAPLHQRIQELGNLIDQRRSDMESFFEKKAAAEEEIRESRHRIEELSQEREIVKAQTTELSGQREGICRELHEAESALRSQRQRHDELQQQQSSLEIAIAEKQLKIENLVQKIQEKYHLHLEDITSACITITYADGGKPRVETLTPEEMELAGAATDWEAVARQVRELQEKLDSMGPVNLVAIEEYEETEQRYAFLCEQRDDLTKAKDQLLEVIQRINKQTKEMFVETFEHVRENFRGLFTEIFGGGKADLQLVDERDVLESGIEIVARPPGKQLQSISLLSGGEQTMTAVALLFAIYQVRPSPFCVLDELDAPLDESNINRFINILKRFLEFSQFIIITHNKRTISIADVLYGVTMQERGVSRIVSVKFHKAGEEDSGSPPKLLESEVSSEGVEAGDEEKPKPAHLPEAGGDADGEGGADADSDTRPPQAGSKNREERESHFEVQMVE